jgi:DNA replication and repair protein RecF
MARAVLRRIVLTDFRSYAEAALSLDGRPVVLFGRNGAGKTNLLEAVSVLAPGSGLRGASAQAIGRREPGAAQGRPWAVHVAVEGEAGAVSRLGAGLPPGAQRRTLRLDGETVSAARLAERLRLVWLTPDQDRLFTEASAERRRFLDRLVFAAEPRHAAVVSAYEKALRERMRVLADARDAGRAPDPAWLDALEARLAEAGEALSAARAQALASLQTEIDGRGDRPFPQADVGLIGEWAAVDPDYGPRLRHALKAARDRDAAAGRALTGPHRTDLGATLRTTGRPAAESSTGEQKALLLNLVLAQAARLAKSGGGDAEKGAESAPNPIVLLDEAAAHLDPSRRAALFDEIAHLGLQAFLTGADRHLFQGLEGRMQAVSVEAGVLTPET